MPTAIGSKLAVNWQLGSPAPASATDDKTQAVAPHPRAPAPPCSPCDRSGSDEDSDEDDESDSGSSPSDEFN